MSLFCFFVPARQPEPAQSELNAFLSAQRVLAVQSQRLQSALWWPDAPAWPRAGANRQSPGVLVGGSGRRTLPGCLVAAGRGR